MTLQNGMTIADRYRLMRLIATGGMGQVWEALDTRLNRRVAVKVLKAEYTNDPEFIARFRAEAQTTAKLNNVDPRAWLADVLARIADHPASRLDELLPWKWRRAQTPATAAA